MEIDPAIYNQYRDTPFKPEDMYNNQNYIKLGPKIKNPNMDEYVNYVLENIKESEPEKEKKFSYNIILTTSLDKTKNINKSDNSLLDNNTNDVSNLDTTNACSKNDITLNLKIPKKFNNEKDKNMKEKNENETIIESLNNNDINIPKKEIENKANVNMIVEDENCKKNFGGVNNENNYDDDYETKNNNKKYNSKMYYNPFNKKNNNENSINNTQNGLSEEVENKISYGFGKLPNITLTSFLIPSKDKIENDGKFSKFFNLFRFKKKQKNEESKANELKNNDKNELTTLEQKLKSESDMINSNENKNKEKLNNNKKYDYIFGKLPSKKDKINSNKDIEKLKSELSGNDDMNKEKNEDNLMENKGNNQCFIVKAEPIFNSDNKNDINNSSDEENNLNNSSQMIDIDKSSEFTLQTGTNIDLLIRKKQKFSPLLMGILFGSCGLFYLLYKKINFKELLSKVSELSKKIPEFFKYFLAIICSGLKDFMERYDDIYRLLVGLLCIMSFWIIFKFLMKKIMKKIKNRK